jgi:3-oxoacyl-[acyl-carrier protein] reductase
MDRLQGKVAVVTGASKGIGAAIARALAAEGAAVVVNYASDKAGAEKAVATITAAGGKAVAVQGDVSKGGDVERLFAAAKDTFGKLDVLVNNAGVYGFAALEAVTEEEYHRQHNTNVLGTILSIREAAKYFGDRGGSVINISSVASTAAMPHSVVYSATKGAVDAITRVLAAELAPRTIRVNTVAPGLVETEGTHTMGVIGSDMGDAMIAQVPLGRVGQPEDIAKVVVFLASDESGWMTGDRLVAAGGQNY